MIESRFDFFRWWRCRSPFSPFGGRPRNDDTELKIFFVIWFFDWLDFYKKRASSSQHQYENQFIYLPVFSSKLFFNWQFRRFGTHWIIISYYTPTSIWRLSNLNPKWQNVNGITQKYIYLLNWFLCKERLCLIEFCHLVLLSLPQSSGYLFSIASYIRCSVRQPISLNHYVITLT